MTVVIKMFIIKLFLIYYCVVSSLTYLYRHRPTLCGPTLPGMAKVSPNMAQIKSPYSLVELGQKNIFFNRIFFLCNIMHITQNKIHIVWHGMYLAKPQETV